ncbi:hypothetical protein O181_016881 [Austropuccinia psidii MF-1]|uniref:Integrase catalytic domain-containing protein n=1 Tax=Austropuccinia psidii MF-1 TaxID=1389203 RepID=A0A9Q3C2I8_9BASI|nr:hypothetical protein [Austropuccinia psidii MF-1]
MFLDKLKGRGICFEQGPPSSPQTNGVMERFNQSLLSKMRCIIVQSNVPTYLWNEEAEHASFLLNQLPHKYLKFKYQIDKLDEFNSRLEPRIYFNKTLPFDPQTGQIKITQDYSVSPNPISAVIQQPENSIPQDSTVGILLKFPSHDEPPKQKLPIQESIVENQNCLLESISSGGNHRVSMNKHYDYVPFYEGPDKNISSNISSENIIEGKRLKKLPNRLMLTDTVPYTQAITNVSEQNKWKDAMDNQFNSLMNYNTGELVPYPNNNEKVIGGMGCLTQKRKEFGKVYH